MKFVKIRGKPNLFILTLFTLLTIVMLYPLSLSVTTMVAEPTDPLLNAWRMQWNGRALLSSPDSLLSIFDTNILHPYPLTLAYSEHFILLTAQILPLILLPDSHLVGLNVSVLLTFVLSGYGMYLLMTAWTHNRWAGVIAGLLFAFSPNRFGQLNHLELLITPWMPLTLLTLHWTLTRPDRRTAIALIVLLNLQALSGFHFFFNLVIACILMTSIYLLTGRIHWRWGLWLTGGVSVLSVLLLNSPIWAMYLRFSDLMGAVRTAGEVRVYSAALTDYLTAIPYNSLYGWTFGYWPADDRQFQPLMPFGVTGALLAMLGVGLMIYDLRFTIYDLRFRKQNRSLRQAQAAGVEPVETNRLLFPILLSLLGLLLSFGLYENSVGAAWAWLMAYSPYQWLYENVIIFQAIRVPARFSILTVLGLTILAGFGVARLNYWLSRTHPTLPKGGELKKVPPLGGFRGADSQEESLMGRLTGRQLLYHSFFIILALLILTESWSAPLRGPEFPVGPDIPLAYDWLREETSPDSLILELPHDDASEFLYEYYSTHHWRRMVNGGTGYTPPIYRDLREWFSHFPDANAVDVAQQLGVDYVLLHQARYNEADWAQVMSDLPRYWPHIATVRQFESILVLELRPPSCQTEAAQIQVSAAFDRATFDIAQATVMYVNPTAAAFVADVRQVSRLMFGNQADDQPFLEPLVTPAGETQTVNVPIESPPSQIFLATLQRTLNLNDALSTPPPTVPPNLQPLGLTFENGTQLTDYSLPVEPLTPCRTVDLSLSWQQAQIGDVSLVQLLDPFGRVVAEQQQPLLAATDLFKRYRLPLLGTLPPGEYGLRIGLLSNEGTPRQAITDEGVVIPADRLPRFPLLIYAPPSTDESLSADPLAQFAEGIQLIGATIEQTELSATEWLRFSLTWQTNQTLSADYTVFTQLLGADGRVWGQFDNQPKGGWYRTTLWPLGQPLSDDYAFPLQADAPPGAYRLIVGLYDNQTQTRLPLADGSADFVEVGTITRR